MKHMKPHLPHSIISVIIQNKQPGSAHRVIITAPSSDAPIFIRGVNDDSMLPEMTIVSVGCSTSNCLAVMLSGLQQGGGQYDFDMVSACSVHAATASQRLVDGPCAKV